MRESTGCHTDQDFSALPQGPGQIIFAGTLGEFGVAAQAFVILLFVASGAHPGKDTGLINLDQIQMGLPPAGFLGLVLT